MNNFHKIKIMSAVEEPTPLSEHLIQDESEICGNSAYDRSFDVAKVGENLVSLESQDICEEVLGNKMAALEITEITTAGRMHNGDGSDSGVEIVTTLNVCLQRALSSNSGGYASSNGGLDEPNVNGNGSCNSSVISYNSDLCDHKTTNTVLNMNSNYECTSENGSESSSVTGGPTTVRKLNNVKKKVAMFEPINNQKPTKKPTDSSGPLSTAGQLNKSRSRVATLTRASSVTRPSPPMLQTRERARSREKTEKNLSTSSSKNTTPPYRSTPVRRPTKPDSLPFALNTTSPSLQRITVQRTPSLTRARTPGTPSDDGRWPSINSRGGGINSKRGVSATPDLASLKSKGNMASFDSKSSPNPYGTLPRRRKQKSVEDLTGRNSRSNSITRAENRMTSSVIVTAPIRKALAMSFREQTPSRTASQLVASKVRKPIPKTKIYHEISIQTAITSQDVENAFAGSARCIKIDAIEMFEKTTQSDIRDKEMERLHEEIRQLTFKQNELNTKLNDNKKKISNMEQQLQHEREEKIAVQRELHLNTERVIGMLELARGTPTEDEGTDSLLMLESQIQMSGHVLTEKQEEITKLRRICRTLQTEMERSLAAQECLLREKASLEKESNELQDFLQNEKTALCEALKDAEFDLIECKKKLDDKEEEVKVLRDECRHLVRLNEQRRQENKTMQSKYAALETKSKDLIVQQGTAVSGASLALSGLHTRLNSLVEQLISSYNISEQDLEDVVFHNEAYTNSGSSYEGSPEYENSGKVLADQNDGSLSPQRNQSFLAAVLSAIKSATVLSTRKLSTRHKKSNDIQNGDESDSTEMLDSETEPCLMMDNVLEDVPMHDSHSHNMVSSNGMMISQIEVPSDLIQAGDESLHNLSQAIANRQQIESQINSIAAQKVAHFRRNRDDSFCEDNTSCHDSVAEMPSITDYCSAQGVVDQVIEVDNIVTKLLKVLRLIQMDNDNCIQHLIMDKNKLQLNKEEMFEKFKDLEDINVKLQDELMDATQELMMKGNDLSSAKTEIKRHHNEIDRLNEDICQLSTFCSQHNLPSKSLDIKISKQTILEFLKIWQKDGTLLEPEIIGYIAKICNDIALLQNDICNFDVEQKQQITKYMHENSIKENKRQYDTIDRALNVLNSIPNILDMNPSLKQLQKDLEESNFQSSSTLPIFTAFITTTNNLPNLQTNHHASPTNDVNANGSSSNSHLTYCESSNYGQTNSNQFASTA